MADIFISYARKDIAAAENLAGVLQGRGWSIFWDRRIPTGREFAEFIHGELAAARCVVVLWSENGVKSRWVKEEASVGADKGILMPVILQGVVPPFGFTQLQAADLSHWDSGPHDRALRQFLADVEGLIGSPEVEHDREPVEPCRANEPRRVEAPTETEPPALSPLPELRDQPTVWRELDRPWCPEMVSIASGIFMMGSPRLEPDAWMTERPRRLVTITAPFSAGRFPVTLLEYREFCDATQRERPPETDALEGARPVVNVSWTDARDYAVWLSELTGRRYRLLSEAEWEYACRAGTETRYSCGNTLGSDQANFGKDPGTGDTTPVGSYPANPWGLCDMHGNVLEWVEDTWHDDYKNAPSDGSAWTDDGHARRRVLRGGSWANGPRIVRSASRYREDSTFGSRYIGFRVAKTLPE